ncbi:MAG: hypothetical protein GY774_38400 [Planctomycetes bacterium]|nr:hypothetical protein [Planctomycetota bacterium]
MLKQYCSDPEKFSIKNVREAKTRSIDLYIEESIIKELKIDKKAIQHKDIPLKYYNYSYLKDSLEAKYNQKVSSASV